MQNSNPTAYTQCMKKISFFQNFMGVADTDEQEGSCNNSATNNNKM
jgi:hypothetical protein